MEFTDVVPFGEQNSYPIQCNFYQFFAEASAWQPDTPKDTLSIAACDRKPVSPRFDLTSCAASLVATTTINPLSRNLWPRNGQRNAERKKMTPSSVIDSLSAMNIELHHLASNIQMQRCLDLFFQPLPLELLQFPLLLPQEVFSCLEWLHCLIWEAKHKHSISTCKNCWEIRRKLRTSRAALSVKFLPAQAIYLFCALAAFRFFLASSASRWFSATSACLKRALNDGVIHRRVDIKRPWLPSPAG